MFWDGRWEKDGINDALRKSMSRPIQANVSWGNTIGNPRTLQGACPFVLFCLSIAHTIIVWGARDRKRKQTALRRTARNATI